MVDGRREPVTLAELINRDVPERERSGAVPSTMGRPATSPGLVGAPVGGLLRLRHAVRLPDKAVLARWVEAPAASTSPARPSSSAAKAIKAGRASGAAAPRSLEQVAVDATATERTIDHPTDGRPHERARAQRVDLAREADVGPRPSGARLTPRRLAAQASRPV